MISDTLSQINGDLVSGHTALEQKDVSAAAHKTELDNQKDQLDRAKQGIDDLLRRKEQLAHSVQKTKDENIERAQGQYLLTL